MKVIAGNVKLEGPVYEFGSMRVPGQEKRKPVKDYFEGTEYIGCDMRSGPGVDKILDLHNIDLPDACAGTVILLDVLEHVEYCRKAMDEVYRILKPGGVCIVVSLMYFPIHSYPYDYWRFTPEGFRSLTAMFQHSIIETVGLKDFPCTVMAVGFKGDYSRQTVAEVEKAIKVWKANWSYSWQEYLTAIIPPVIAVKMYSLFVRFSKK
jgi:SAM-dependent methyltransferase